MNNQIADFIIRIKNASLAKRKEVILPFSNLNKDVGKNLVKLGFLENIKEETVKNRKMIKATIKYFKRSPVLSEIEILSKPSLRVYGGAKEIEQLERKGKRTVIVSTSQGVITGKEARKKGVGGEILFAIW